MTQQKQLFEAQPDPWQLDAMADAMVAKVVFPSAPAGEFDYLVPPSLRASLRPGSRVQVPLGKGNRKRVAYCVALATAPTDTYRLKPIASLVDPVPLITPDILALTEWIAEYYVCDRGTVLETVIPASVRGKAGTHRVTYLSVARGVAARLTQLELPKKQTRVMEILAGSPVPLAVADLAVRAGCTTAPITALRKKGLLVATVRREFREEHVDIPAEPQAELQLNPQQIKTHEAIIAAMDSRQHQTILVHGVTGSGKTEVYIRAIEYALSFGRGAIVLVPEISLTPQTRRRFRARFQRVAVLHSNLSPGERHAEWQRIASGDVDVVVGARSAVFAPHPHLGLIVIDEEHETSFKQESAPRYHAREVAAQRAAGANIPLVLGSATPSLESWHHARKGTYQLVQIPHRVLDRPLPQVATIDMRDDYSRSGSRLGVISRQLHREMSMTLESQGQIILLLNRRGFATHIQCPACGEVVRCQHCDIALTHHKADDRAVCHYCSYQITTPHVCPSCKFQGIRMGGFGTQRLENEVKKRFPSARIARMDADTTRAAGSHEVTLGKFRAGEIDILLGTQMIAKGLDFPNVTLVGVINADIALHLPDFRAAERTFQLVTQVAGRTGRGERGGKVLVQTFSPDNPAIVAAAHHDYQAFADHELPQREQFSYPPFSQLVRLVFRGDKESTTEAAASTVAASLEDELPATIRCRLLGPVPAPISRLRGKFRFHLLLQTDCHAAWRSIFARVDAQTKLPSDVQWIVDVDPIAML